MGAPSYRGCSCPFSESGLHGAAKNAGRRFSFDKGGVGVLESRPSAQKKYFMLANKCRVNLKEKPAHRTESPPASPVREQTVVSPEGHHRNFRLGTISALTKHAGLVSKETGDREGSVFNLSRCLIYFHQVNIVFSKWFSILRAHLSCLSFVVMT